MPSLRSTIDQDPYGFYERLRASGGVVRDEEMGAWLVVSYPLVREVMRQDNKLVQHTAASNKDEVFRTIVGGSRSRHFANREAHSRHHRWFVHRFTYGVVDEWRETLLRPILDRILDPIIPHGRIEFLTDISDKFSVRVIAAVMGLPWEDDEWIQHCKRLLDRKQRYIDVHSAGASPGRVDHRDAA